jgi:hypothetical protein
MVSATLGVFLKRQGDIAEIAGKAGPLARAAIAEAADPLAAARRRD